MKFFKGKLIYILGIFVVFILLSFMLSSFRPFLSLFLAIMLIFSIYLNFKYKIYNFKILYISILIISILYIIFPVKFIFGWDQTSFIAMTPILYGLPSPEGMRKIDNGDYFPGGCMVGIFDPKYVITFRKYNVSNGCGSVGINNIVKKAHSIENNIAKYAITSKDLWRSTEGGQQTDYSLDNKIVLIKQIFFGETGKSELSYYLQNDKVFYILEKDTAYLLPLSEDSSAKVKNFEIKDFYLDSSQFLCSWHSNQKLQSNDQATKDLVKNLILGLY
ncbi:MAG: hypothetical protein NTX82_03115 [Candidatus Parcubacteria bacterium]|nr:hypothetical protein [Candidatus Parcubacteria bacterium]